MRDPDRIPEVIDEVEQYWQENPDLRLAQIIWNIGRERGHERDPFYMEDGELLDALRDRNA